MAIVWPAAILVLLCMCSQSKLQCPLRLGSAKNILCDPPSQCLPVASTLGMRSLNQVVSSSLVVYGDGPGSSFFDASWGGHYSLTERRIIQSGRKSISLSPQRFNGVMFKTLKSFMLHDDASIRFWVYGSGTGGQKLWVGVTDASKKVYRAFINRFLPKHTITRTRWTQVTVPLTALGIDPTIFLLEGIYIMDGSGKKQATVYVDSIVLRGVKPAVLPPAPPPPGGSLGWMYTQGNGIYNSDGSRWLGRGANIPDPRGCGACFDVNVAVSAREVNRRVDELVDVWGANFMRLTLESRTTSSVLNNPDYLAAIGSIVDHVNTKNMARGLANEVRILMSVWIDPSLQTNGWPSTQTNQVLAKLASTFSNSKHLMFGLCNEPQRNYDGAQDAQVWEAMNSAAAAIRDVEHAAKVPQHLIAVQGTGGWSRFLQYYVNRPLTAGGGTNFAYEVHVYDPVATFDARFVKPSQNIPVIIGEFGPVNSDDAKMSMDDCSALMTRAESLKIPYLAWDFAFRCSPDLLVDTSGGGCGIGTSLEPTAWGRLVQKQYQAPWGASNRQGRNETARASLDASVATTPTGTR